MPSFLDSFTGFASKLPQVCFFPSLSGMPCKCSTNTANASISKATPILRKRVLTRLGVLQGSFSLKKKMARLVKALHLFLIPAKAKDQGPAW